LHQTLVVDRQRQREARRRLQALGLSNLTLKLWVPTSSQAWNPSPLKTAELIQADMAQVGVKVIIPPRGCIR
jgi:cationic peptide transport system substrate-binding protein